MEHDIDQHYALAQVLLACCNRSRLNVARTCLEFMIDLESEGNGTENGRARSRVLLAWINAEMAARVEE